MYKQYKLRNYAKHNATIIIIYSYGKPTAINFQVNCKTKISRKNMNKNCCNVERIFYKLNILQIEKIYKNQLIYIHIYKDPLR